MILRHLYLLPNELDFGVRESSSFNDRTRSFCSFLERRVAREKFRAPFGRVCVIGSLHPREDCFVNSCNVVSVEVPFSRADYEDGFRDQPNEHFIHLFETGLAKLSEQHAIPLGAFREGIEDFRRSGYRNEWTWKKKRPRGLGLTISFDCSLTMERFTLRMKVYRQSRLLLDELVLDTAPNELLYVQDFKKISVSGSVISVLDFLGEPTYSRDLIDLLHDGAC